MLRNILLGVGVFAALFAVLIFSGKMPVGKSGQTKVTGEVVIWGTISGQTMNPLIQAYNAQAQSYRVTYKEFREDSIATSLVEALANGAGPDMLLAPDGVILSQSSRIYPFPYATLSETKFKQTYVDAGSVFLSPTGALALPVTVDPMVLFFNRRMFAVKSIISPPVYWDEVAKIAPVLTELNNRGQFVQSGIALGAATTPYAKDILMTIVRQLGQVPVIKQYGQDGKLAVGVTVETPLNQADGIRPLSTALRFFATFADPAKATYSWNDFSGSAADAFVSERLAMYLGYSSEFGTLVNRNPRASFDMAAFPQTRNYNTSVTAAKVYGIATLKTSKNLVAALTVESTFGSLGVAQAIAPAIGAVPAMRSEITNPAINEIVAKGMLTGANWYDANPQKSSQLISSMIGDVINNRSGPTDAAELFVMRLQELYNPR